MGTPAVGGSRFSRGAAARHGEVRLPASIAVIVAAVLHSALPSALLLEPRWVIPTVEVALLVPLVAVNPTRMTNETRRSRVLGLLLVAVLIVANTISLGYVLRELTSAHAPSGRDLLLAAAQVWGTNIIAFALVYWELDRGGAVARLPSSGVPLRRADFLFPQDDETTAKLAMGDGDTTEDVRWIPVFVDYLYLSITNSSAFSPTDTLPLTTRAKLLMSVEGLSSLILSLLVIARAVNILN